MKVALDVWIDQIRSPRSRNHHRRVIWVTKRVYEPQRSGLYIIKEWPLARSIKKYSSVQCAAWMQYLDAYLYRLNRTRVRTRIPYLDIARSLLSSSDKWSYALASVHHHWTGIYCTVVYGAWGALANFFSSNLAYLNYSIKVESKSGSGGWGSLFFQALPISWLS